MDIKEKIEEIVKNVKNSKDLKEKFATNPVKVVEEILGIDLPDELIEKIIEGAKEKLSGTAENAEDITTGLLGKLKGLFGGKN